MIDHKWPLLEAVSTDSSTEGVTMQSLNRTFSASVLAVAGLAAVAGAQAQGSTPTAGGSGYSWYAPGATYIGLNAGQSNYSLSSGVGAFPSDKTHSTYNLYGGGYFSNNFGLELGYTNFGKINRAGGTTKGEGINLS
ncbi:MAG: hypothetical protein ACRD3R_04435, partial [Terriglobales bacterium]